ncbi:unnamed protein product [Fusarium graminearum]|uniref:Uncharacterized protein n=1 Tax=Gibberella zeae TaxID=5518 RepID=A0A4E9EJ13_GIBZA|nr:unnamed protein product [Fusarium graminearum]CAF3612513.1 unnamed protein product [Fusarium graminearum]CAG1964292.1 unnamed protein product [Fusarium graminearum]CAG1986057.1 unnamed protein product [Fusarium graminearum]
MATPSQRVHDQAYRDRRTPTFERLRVHTKVLPTPQALVSFSYFFASPRQAALNWSDRGEGAEAWGKVAYWCVGAPLEPLRADQDLSMSLSLSQSSSAQFSTNIRVVSMRMKILYCGVYMDSTEWDSFGC